MVAASAHAGDVVKVLVLKEHGVGTSSAAQPYLDKFIANAAQANGWDPSSSGRYVTSRADAQAYIGSDSPRYAIVSLPAFGPLRKAYNLEVVGEAKTDGGGEQYFIISTTLGSLDECKGKKLATDHVETGDDQKFIEKVVAAGAFTMGNFDVQKVKRYGQAASKLLNGEVECALVHEAQLADARKMPNGGTIKTAWQSAKLPGMPIVAFPSAPAGERATFKSSLTNICSGGGASVCQAVGLLSAQASSNATFQSVINAFP
jgi:hypothetical protein